MRRNLARFALLPLFVLVALAVRAGDDAPRNIVLVGWDGAQRAHVQECLAKKELPTLQKLKDEGTLVDLEVTTGATDTKAGWTQILTGLRPEVTGVYSNGRFRPVKEGWSVFERLQAHFGKDKIVTCAIIGKKGHCGETNPPTKVRLDGADSKAGEGDTKDEPKKAGRKQGGKKAGRKQAASADEDEIIEENGVKYRLVGGSPYYGMHQKVNLWDFGLMLDEKVGKRTIEMLDKYKDQPFFFFVHFAEVDHSGHKAGENSKPYDDALISADTWTGRIMDKLKELKLDGKTVVYVTADHGFDEGRKGHRNAPTVFLGTTDPQVKQAGGRADVAATILARFGLDLSKLTPPLAGRPLSQASASAPAPAATAK